MGVVWGGVYVLAEVITSVYECVAQALNCATSNTSQSCTSTQGRQFVHDVIARFFQSIIGSGEGKGIWFVVSVHVIIVCYSSNTGITTVLIPYRLK